MEEMRINPYHVAAFKLIAYARFLKSEINFFDRIWNVHLGICMRFVVLIISRVVRYVNNRHFYCVQNFLCVGGAENEIEEPFDGFAVRIIGQIEYAIFASQSIVGSLVNASCLTKIATHVANYIFQDMDYLYSHIRRNRVVFIDIRFLSGKSFFTLGKDIKPNHTPKL